jgi:RNA polymerase sigma-32 factor
VDEIARSLDVPERDVVHMNRRLWASDHSLNASMQTGSDGEWQDWLIDEADDQETALAEREILSIRAALLRRAIHVLNARELQIVMERWCREKRATLDVLARRHGVSRERVRQIEVRALEKLRVAMNESAGAQTMLQHAA